MNGDRFTHGFGVCICAGCCSGSKARKRRYKKAMKARRVTLARIESKKKAKELQND